MGVVASSLKNWKLEVERDRPRRQAPGQLVGEAVAAVRVGGARRGGGVRRQRVVHGGVTPADGHRAEVAGGGHGRHRAGDARHQLAHEAQARQRTEPGQHLRQEQRRLLRGADEPDEFVGVLEGSGGLWMRRKSCVRASCRPGMSFLPPTAQELERHPAHVALLVVLARARAVGEAGVRAVGAGRGEDAGAGARVDVREDGEFRLDSAQALGVERARGLPVRGALLLDGVELRASASRCAGSPSGMTSFQSVELNGVGRGWLPAPPPWTPASPTAGPRARTGRLWPPGVC